MFGQVVSSRGSQYARQPKTSIHVLGDNLLLKVFYLCRPALADKDEVDNNRILDRRKWNNDRWWYNIAHVCGKWRYLVLDSASHLKLRLVCTYGTPVADMLAHPPPLPLVIDYGDEDREPTAEDVEGILLALRRRRRACHIRLCMPPSNLRILVAAMDGEFPVLGHLYIKPLDNNSDGTNLILPETFKAPHLRHLKLRHVSYSHDMSRYPLSTLPSHRQSVEAIGQCARCCGAQLWRSLRTFIHILDDDSLRRILHLTGPVLLGDDEVDPTQILQYGKWSLRWCSLSHVCRRWRYLLLSLISHIGPYLLCTYDTPVADMLAHSPPLPVIMDYGDETRQVTVQNMEGIVLALQRRRRVLRILLRMPASNLRKLVVAIDGEFPMLEYLCIKPLTEDGNGLVLSETFKAPHLRHLSLGNIAYPPDAFHLRPPTPPVQSADGISQCSQCNGTTIWRSLRIYIHTLDDDSLLNIFSLCRPVLIDEEETNDIMLSIVRGGLWSRERWWYKFVHVCRRWRHLVLTSVSHLGLVLLCTYGMPVTDMLAHSPPLPLILDFLDEHHDITVEDEEGITLALRQRDRVRRIRLRMFVPMLQKFIEAFDGEFPILEFFHLGPPTKTNTELILPEAFRAPQLRHLALNRFAFPIKSHLVITTMGLVTLSLMWIYPSSAYFHPHELLQRISHIPQLEVLRIGFNSPVPKLNIESQLLDGPIMTHVALPNLRWFTFFGTSAYLEALLPRMTTPSLEKLQILFFHQLTYSIPNLVDFTLPKENMRFSMARILFKEEEAFVRVYPREGRFRRELHLHDYCRNFDWQVSFIVQVLTMLSTMFSAVEDLSLKRYLPTQSLDLHNEIDHTRWQELLWPFSHVKTLHVNMGNKLTKQLLHSLQLGDEESPMALLPELKELKHSGRPSDNAFKPFIDSRQKAGYPITFVRI